MNTYNINDTEFLNSALYRDFIKENPGLGRLSVRAYTASSALPIKGLNLEVSTIFNNNKIVVFDGVTDESGTVDNISLPAPIYDENNLVSPMKIVYNLKSTYKPFDFIKDYSINVFDGISVMQTITVNDNGMEAL